jgi:F-type H+-transporting ATPase subunit epsilon
MAKVMTLEVVTPERVSLKVEINSLVAPATEGPLGVLYNHAPLITGLEPGVLKYRQGEKVFILAVGSGFMEIADNLITVLVDTAEKPEEIDVERALAAKERAEKRLLEQNPSLDVHRAELALHRALARLKAADYNRAP